MRRELEDGAGWTLSDHLLAAAVDALRGANYQRSGNKGAKPKPIPRPGVTRQHRHGHTERTPAEVASYFAQFAPPPPPADNADMSLAE